jgi:cytochrome c-type biogenesis protein
MTLLSLAAQSGIAERLSDAPLTALLTLFGAGVLTSLTPCIYPMIPITAGILAASRGDAEPSKVRTLGLTLTYVFGLSLFYAVLGLIAGLSGSLFGTISANPWARITIGVLLTVFALAMLDVFPISIPQQILRWTGSLGGGSYVAVFVLGATSGLVAAPCGAPAFAAVLTWVSTTTHSAVLGFLYLFVFSLGMTALLVAVGLFSGLAVVLPKAGRWMVWVKKGAGLLLLGMAGYYMVLAGQVW